MVTQTTPLADLYQQDETAWLEEMVRLLAAGRLEQLDVENLRELLADMARRDRRAVYNRLVVLLTHLLKWQHQPEQRSNSWRGTILSQRRRLRLLLESGTLRNYAAAVLPEVYLEARAQAAAESGLPLGTFPTEQVRSVDELLAADEEGNE